MKIYVVACAFALALVSFGSSAEACTVKAIGDACDVQRIQQAKPDHNGPLAATPTDMVCLTALASRPNALVLAEGRVEPGAEVTGHVLTSWRLQASMWKQTARGFEREICFPARLAQGVVTLCDDHNRSIWSASDTRTLRTQKRIVAQDAACLLGKDSCKKHGL